MLGGAPQQPAMGGGLAGFGIGMGGPSVPDIQFAAQSDCDGDKFQTLWMQLPEAG